MYFSACRSSRQRETLRNANAGLLKLLQQHARPSSHVVLFGEFMECCLVICSSTDATLLSERFRGEVHRKSRFDPYQLRVCLLHARILFGFRHQH